MAIRLADHLNTFTKSSLLALRRYVVPLPDLAARAMSKEALIEDMSMLLLTPDAVTIVWECLGPLSRTAIRDALTNRTMPGRLDVVNFWRHHGCLIPHIRHEQDEATLKEALMNGLLFDAEFELVPEFVPHLRRMARNQQQTPEHVRLDNLPAVEWSKASKELVKEVPLLSAETESHVLADFVSVLRLIEAGRIKVNANSLRPAQPALKAVSAAVSLGEYPQTAAAAELRSDNSTRAHSLIVVSMAAGWAAPDQAVGGLALTDSGRRFVRQPDAEGLKAGLQRWLDCPQFDEVERNSSLHGVEGALVEQGSSPVLRRHAVIDLLRTLPPDKWVDVEELLRALEARRSELAVESGERSRLWIGSFQGYDNERVCPPNSQQYWRIVTAQAILAILMGPLASFGIIDIGYLPAPGSYFPGIPIPRALRGGTSANDVLRYVRLTSLGCFLLGLSQRYAKSGPAKPALRVLPNRQIIITTHPGGRRAAHPMLNKLCDQVSEDVFVLSRARLIATIDTGELTVGGILEFLRAESGGPLPDTVEDMITEAGRRGRLITEAEAVRLFHLATTALAIELEHDRTLAGMNVLRAGDWLIVPADKVSAFRRRCHALGYGVILAMQAKKSDSHRRHQSRRQPA